MIEDKEKLEKLVDTFIWYFSEKQMFPRIRINEIEQRFDELIRTIKSADESSTKLTIALNRITKAGVFVAMFGIIVAMLSLIFEVIKYFYSR